MEFFGRKYSLQIGNSETGDGLLIEDLQVQFRVRKSVNNKSKIDRCSVTIYNLSEESLAILETDYRTAILSCGYEGDVIRLFNGEITEVETKKQGVDRVTKLDISPAFSDLTFKVMSELIPENGVVQDVIEVIRRQTGLSKGVYKGKNLSTRIVYGYPLSGTPKEMLDLVCNEYNLEWHIEDKALYINDSESVESESKELAPLISEVSGLIDRPYFFSGSDRKSSKDTTKREGVKFKALLNPNIKPGSLVRVDYEDNSNFYRVEEVVFTGDYRGSAWYMDCVCSKRLNT